ncbi:MAG TPA: glycosyltransferase [Actinocrinis sp.]|uniref:glycosyltransferase n=1 Tax=Actinocrinis sp. TaxID=1920516 RepID=UPI002DDD409A|nr:glycosyltransferase [Actinocrinis sp.]HEV2343131.1 glycosyltransferase [Actinocrinis sp.]
MSHIGLVTPPYTGHVAPMVTLGRELQRRGHRASVISTPDVREEVLRGEVEFISVGAEDFPPGALKAFTDKQGKLTGTRAIRFIIKDMAKIAMMHSRELPDAVTRNGVDALVVDQIQPIGAAVALRYDLPYVNICSLLPLNTELGIPPWTMYWPYEETNQARVKNKIAYRVRYMLEMPITKAANPTRVKWGLPAVTADGSFSDLAQIVQIPEAFDFPRKEAPEVMHYTGPLHEYDGTDSVPFPWDELDGRPLIYATMGTLVNRKESVFRAFAEACVGINAQLVISLGNRGAKIPTGFAGNPIVVDYAPQLELLKRASLYIGPGGMNSLMHSLGSGVPMVLIPVTFDNPGVAARAKYHGVGEYLPVNKLTAARLRTKIETVLGNPAYRDNAARIQDAIRGVDAVGRAADIVEQAFRTRRPVLRPTPDEAPGQ